MSGKENKKSSRFIKSIEKYNDGVVTFPTDKQIYESDECLSYKTTDERLAFYNGAKFLLKYIENQ